MLTLGLTFGLSLGLLANGIPGLWGLTFVDLLKYVIIVCGCIAVLWVVIRKLGIQIPDWVMQLFWIVVVVLLALLAINIIVAMF